ncbi:MAG: TonB-dependent receptor plug domain-containing protein [candidate division Zixibacteria bacterium]|nr:TonB-dependent receptor plug domain-containing protein [candidate division Zixibacteria bacterium]
MLSCTKRPFPDVFFVLKINIIIICLSIAPFSSPASALDSHNLHGRVLDIQTGSPVKEAQARIERTGHIIVTGRNGNFTFSELPSGEYKIEISAEGYHTLRRIIAINDGPDIDMVFQLTPIVVQIPGTESVSSRDRYDPRGISRLGLREIGSDEEFTHDNIGEIAEQLPGVFVRENGPGGKKTISINGCDPSRVDVIYDGILLNNGNGQPVDISVIPITAVGSIEVFSNKGGVGGLVVIKSKSFNDLEARKVYIDETVADFKTSRTRTGGEFRYMRTGIRVNYERETSRGDFTYTDPLGDEQTRINNHTSKHNLHGKLSLPVKGELDVIFNYNESAKGSAGPIYQLDSTAIIKNERYLANINYSLDISKNSGFSLRAGGINNRDGFTSNSGFVKYDVTTDESRYFLAAGFNNESLIEWGMKAQYAYEDFKTDDYLGTANNIDLKVRRKLDLSADAAYSLNLDLSGFPVLLNSYAEIKNKHATGYKSYTGYNWGLESVFASYITLSSGIFGGANYKLPDYYSLFFKEDIWAIGNPYLKPEKSKSIGYKLNVSRRIEDVPVAAGYTFTVNSIDDIIVWKRRFDGKYTPDNISRAELRTGSFNFSVGSMAEVLHIQFQHNRYRPVNKNDFRLHHDKILVYRPLYTAYLNIDFGSKWTRFGIRHEMVGKRFTTMENTKWQNPYQVLSLSFSQRAKFFNLRWKFRFEIENIGDESYEIVDRYPSPGRNYKAGINLTF